MKTLKQITIFILLLFHLSGVAQVVVERSENRVVISGVAYYIHVVKLGETAYSISRAYGITIEELRKENNLSEQYILSEGQSLRIPASRVDQTSGMQAQTRQRDEATYIYHIITPGETIYALSRLYNVSANEIIQSNPDIDINTISIGTEIAIPRRQQQTVNEPQRVEASATDTYFYHEAQRGESLSSIGRLYNVTVRDLRNANSNLWFLRIGDRVRVPGVKPETVVDDTIIEETPYIPVVTEESIPIERPSDFIGFTKLSGKIDVAVLLPFYFRENFTDNIRTRRSEDWIYPESLDFIEMYEGILLAADTLRSLGLDINIYTYEIQSDTVALSRLIRAGNLRNMDLIIGPVYSNNLRIATEYARNFDIPVVSPVHLFNNSLLNGNPNLFMANPTLEVAQNTLAKKIAEYHDHNFIFIHADSLGIDEDVRRFRSAIRREFSVRRPFAEMRFREMRFLSRSRIGNNNRFENVFSPQVGNVVIIASEHAPVISETITDIHVLSRRFDVKVFGYPMLRELETLETRYFFDLNMLLYSSYWIDYAKPNVRQFNANYRKTFFTQPSETSFAWQGYDIAYYFISGLALYGKDFIKRPSIHRPELLHTDFDFVSKSSNDGFENQRLFPIRYTKDFDVILEE